MRNPEAIKAATLPNRTSPWKTMEEEQVARQLTAEAQVLRLAGDFTRSFGKVHPFKGSPPARECPAQTDRAHGLRSAFIHLSV
ncbi:MAG: hypothetical protein STSR0004_02620 [Peptococcaceae bacterium]